jgi:hypothetical protein
MGLRAMTTYKLSIKKNCPRKSRWRNEDQTIFIFSVIDKDKGSFPNNWVCNLPKASCFRNSYFSNLFHDDPVAFAVELLMLAKQEYLNKDIQREIDLRILKFKEIFSEFYPTLR